MEHTRILPAGRPYRACAAIVARYPRKEIEALTEALIESLDGFDDTEDVPDFSPRSDGQPGDPGDHELAGDEQDIAWPEIGSNGRQPLSSLYFGQNEDDEEDDPSGVHDEDGINTLHGVGHDTGPGCIISDNDFEHDGQEPGYESWI
jgi:hypothetical protein